MAEPTGNLDGSGRRRTLSARWIGLGSFLCGWLVLVTYAHVKFHLNVPPSVGGDEIDYDSIGWQLSQGRGFSTDTGDPEFRRPYDEAARTAERFRLGPPVEKIVTDRPPLFPWALSVLNRIVGRQFWAVRLMDTALMSGVLAFLAAALYRRWGYRAVLVLLVLFIVVDVRTRLYSRAILTEAMCAFLATVLIVGMLRLQNRPAAHRRDVLLSSAVLGLIFGLMILARSMIVLWAPGLGLVLFWTIRRHKLGLGTNLGSVAVFLIGTGAVLSPWIVRNLQVTGEFRPLGTQGVVQASAAYGDVVWNSRGLWVNLDQLGFFDEVKTPSQSPLERELAKAKFSQSKALAWIRNNPLKAAALFPLKIGQECRPRSPTEWLLFVLMLAGIAALWRTDLGRLMLAILATNLFAVGVTWSVEGRFLLPVLFPIHVFATAGALWVGAKLRGAEFIGSSRCVR